MCQIFKKKGLSKRLHYYCKKSDHDLYILKEGGKYE